MKKVVGVTGATGTIGKVLIGILEKRGWEVKKLEGDINDKRSVEKLVSGSNWIIHLAIYQNNYDDKYDKFYQVNVKGTENLLEKVAENKVNVLLVSSVMVYKDCGQVERNENWDLNTEETGNFYVRSKIEQLNLLKNFKNLEWMVVIPTIVENKNDIRGGVMSALGDKNRMINVVEINDLCEGIIRCMEKGKMGERYILGGQNLNVESLRSFPFRIPNWVLLVIRNLVIINKYRKLLDNIIYGINYNMNFSSAKAKREIGYNPRWRL